MPPPTIFNVCGILRLILTSLSPVDMLPKNTNRDKNQPSDFTEKRKITRYSV